MNRILHWLTVKLSHPTAAETIEQPGSDDERGFSEEDNPGELPVDSQAASDGIRLSFPHSPANSRAWLFQFSALRVAAAVFSIQRFRPAYPGGWSGTH